MIAWKESGCNHAIIFVDWTVKYGRAWFSRRCTTCKYGSFYILRNGRWQKMFRPINPDRRFSGVSLGESFAECYVKKYNVDVGLICCADGGTTLEQWSADGVLYENAVYQAKLAQRTSDIMGVLWHQGESDCMEALYLTYRERFEMLMKSLRKELNLQDIPFLLGGLGDFLKDSSFDENLKNYQHVNNALENIAQKNKKVGFISAKGLTANPDLLHFNSQSLYEFGKRYFEEFEKLCNMNKIETRGLKNSDILRTEMENL